MKKLSFSILIIFLLIAITGCVRVQVPPAANPATTPWIGSPPVIEIFNINPAAITAGSAATLTWKVTGADSVRIDPGIGNVDTAGSRTITPAVSTTYTISASNVAGNAARSFFTAVNSKPSVPVQFAVSEVTAGLEPSGYNGCYSMYADITANGAGSVSYMWESSNDEGYSYTWTITFLRAGTQRVTLPVEMSALPTGPYRLRVTAPNEIVSNSTLYLTCAR